MRRLSTLAMLVSVTLALAACGSRRPPADYAPDPVLLSRIQGLRIILPPAACPGSRLNAEYFAILNDGTTVPFAERYDRDRPPQLHVMFLSRYSPSALALENGDWQMGADPLLSAMEGFTLRVSLRAKPSVVVEETIRPLYSCPQQVYRLLGRNGGRGEAGGPGPDVTVRLSMLSSPFYSRLIVAGIAVEQALPFYVLADADQVPQSDWLLVASQGGRGGRGADGTNGTRGVDGQPGCPASSGGAGGAGGNGGAGGPGGRGGRLTVVVPDDTPFLAGLVDAIAPGGEGGEGGRAGRGGEGGRAGTPSNADRRCQGATAGSDGPNGRPGADGREGPHGTRPQIIERPLTELYGPMAPATLRALIARHQQRRGS